MKERGGGGNRGRSTDGHPGVSRRPILRAIAAGGALGVTGTGLSGTAGARHPTTACDGVRIDFNRCHVARVWNVEDAGATDLTVFYFDRKGNPRKVEDVDPTENRKYGPLKTRYARGRDLTVIQIGGKDAAVRRVVASGPECRTARTNPVAECAGDNEAPIAEFTWSPETPTVDETVTFTSTASDPDGEIIHYGWDFDGDGVEDAYGGEVTYAFGTAGDHDVTHSVVDGFDAADRVKKTLSVEEAFECVQIAKLPGSGDVSIQGEYAVVGRNVYERYGDTWTAVTKLDAPGDPSGNANDASGDTIILGGRGYEAFVFTRSGGAWQHQATLTPSDGASGNLFGRSVAISGDTALVGAYWDDQNGDEAGAAYVFTRSGETWSSGVKILPSDGGFKDHFGYSVAIDGETALVGARDRREELPPGSSPRYPRAGAGYVFTGSGDSWSEEAILTASDGDNGDDLGFSADVHGDTAVLGATDSANAKNSGAVYVFDRSGSTWSEGAKLLADDPGSYDYVGWSVAVNGDTIVAGAPNHDEADFRAGAVYVFKRDGTGWTQRKELHADDADNLDQLGYSTDFDGQNVIGGTHRGESAGYVFENC